MHGTAGVLDVLFLRTLVHVAQNIHSFVAAVFSMHLVMMACKPPCKAVCQQRDILICRPGYALSPTLSHQLTCRIAALFSSLQAHFSRTIIDKRSRSRRSTAEWMDYRTIQHSPRHAARLTKNPVFLPKRKEEKRERMPCWK